MRPKSMILIVIALGCGLIASIGISQVMENNVSEAPVEAPTATIFVAVADIPPCTAIRISFSAVALSQAASTISL